MFKIPKQECMNTCIKPIGTLPMLLVRLIVLLIALNAVSSGVAIAQAPPSVPSPFEGFKALEERFDWGGLVRRVDQLLAVSPDNPVFWLVRADYLLRALRYEDAITSSRKAISLSPTLSGAWADLGVALWRIGRQEEAVNALREATRLDPNRSWAWLNLWGLLAEIGRYAEIPPVVEQVQRLAPNAAQSFLKSLGDPTTFVSHAKAAPNSNSSSGNQCQTAIAEASRRSITAALRDLEAGNATDAIPVLERAISINKASTCRFSAEDFELRDLLLIAYVQALRISDALGQSVLTRNYERPLRLATSIADHLATRFGANSPEVIRTELSVAYFRLHIDRPRALGPALEAYSKANAQLGPSDKATRWFKYLVGASYNSLGRAKDSRALLTALYDQSARDYGEDDPLTAVTLAELIDVDIKEMNRSEAVSKRAQVVALYTRVFGANHILTVSALISQGATLSGQGHLAAAELQFREARNRLSATFGDNSPDVLGIDYAQASMLYEAKQFDRAAQVLADLAPRLEQYLGRQAPHTLRARLLQTYISTTLGDFGKTAMYGGQLISDIEVLRADVGLSPEDRQRFFTSYAGLYMGQALARAPLNPDEAFRIAESAKARTLLESMALTQANRSGVLDAADQSKIDQFERQLQDLGHQLLEAADSPTARLAIDEQWQRTLAEDSSFRKELRVRNARYRALTDFQIVSAREGLERILDDDTVFISYLVSGATVLGFALSRNEGLMTATIELKDMANSVEAMRRGLKNFADKDSVSSIETLFGLKLIKPFESFLRNKRRLVISPDGPLAFLPFEVLSVNNQPLVTLLEVSYSPSLSVLAMTKERDIVYKTLDTRRQLFAMGGAVYTPDQNVVISQSVETASENARQAIALMQRSAGERDAAGKAFRLMDLRWENLPGTEGEVRAVASLFGPEESTLYVGTKASEEQLQSLNKTKELSKYRYLLFSTHGYVNPEEPALSAIVLSQTGTTPAADGYVTVSEWPSYDLRSDLIVLSACETGVGKFVQGEGILGLPYALYVAGNKNLLLTLWPIADDATREFMWFFFSLLKSGKPAATALTLAKRRFASSEKYSHPLFWAPYVLYGY